jgi:hypothetical protein
MIGYHEQALAMNHEIGHADDSATNLYNMAVDYSRHEECVRTLLLTCSLGESEEERGLLAMLLTDFYRKTIHAPVITLAVLEFHTHRTVYQDSCHITS